VAQLLPSNEFEGRAALEAKMPITVSAADVGGKTFTVMGRKHPPLQAGSGRRYAAQLASESGAQERRQWMRAGGVRRQAHPRPWRDG